VEYFAIKNWDQTDGGTHRRFMIRYASGVTRDTAKRGFDGRKAEA
jgi:hypothetical protein